MCTSNLVRPPTRGPRGYNSGTHSPGPGDRYYRRVAGHLALREVHLGIRRLDADAPRASEQLRAAYDAAMRDDTGKPPASPQP